MNALAGLPLFDICQNRHGGNAESAAAFARVARSHSAKCEAVYSAICEAGPDGLTCKELAARWGVGMNEISGRWTDLKAAERIERVLGRDGKPVSRNGSGAYKRKGDRDE